MCSEDPWCKLQSASVAPTVARHFSVEIAFASQQAFSSSEVSNMQPAQDANVGVQEVIEIALGSESSNRLVQETALFSLGNMANLAAVVAVMQSGQIESKVSALLDSPHSNLRAVANRLASKLKAWGDTAH
jgi:hypothetical protein